MPTSAHKQKKRFKKLSRKSSALLTKHRLIAVLVALIAVSALTGAELRGLLVGPKHTPKDIGWIIDGDQLQGLISFAPSALPHTFFGSPKTIVLENKISAVSKLPPGWQSTEGNHYTSFITTGCKTGCYSFLSDANDKHSNINASAGTKPIAMLDDEAWFRTPAQEQYDPCGTISQFVQYAKAYGLQTIVAPDQDLAEPGLLTKYQGEETENWQSYLRLGLATCSAASGASIYHIMSQPFEAHWCGNPLGECQSSESDFVDFVTQASLQAKAINPNIKISDGLSTATKYFGNFQGASAIAQIMYRDYADVTHMVNYVWMNVVGRNADTTVLYFLSMLGENQPSNRRSSVFFLQDNNTLTNSQPAADKLGILGLTKGAERLFTSKQTIEGGTTLPAGTGDFQFWTSGNPNQYANLSIQFGYCNAKKCTGKTTINNLNVRVNGGGKGAVRSGGAFTNRLDTTLPNGGPYKLFVQVTVQSGNSFSLFYGSHTSSTNISTPILLPIEK